MYRLKDKTNGKEYMAWNETLSFTDKMDNVHTLDYNRCGVHDEPIGNIRKDINGKITGAEVTGIKVVFDKEWSTKSFEELMKHQGGEKETEYVIGLTKNRGKDALYSQEDKAYSVNCAEDFKTAKFEELLELGRRGLSGTDPSLKKLAQPISEDPASSLAKRERGYISPSQISYSQTSYR